MLSVFSTNFGAFVVAQLLLTQSLLSMDEVNSLTILNVISSDLI